MARPQTHPPSSVGLALALTLGASSLAAAAPLRYDFSPGSETRYRMVMNSRTAVQVGERSTESTLETRLNMLQRVLAVSPEGVARVLTRVDSGKVRTPEGQSRMMPPRETTMRVTPRGMILEGELPEQRLAPLRMVFPEEDATVGTTWSASQPPTPQVPVPLVVRYTVVGEKTIEGRSCVEIEVRIHSAEASAAQVPMDMKFEAAGTMYFDHRAGLLVRSDLRSDLRFTMQRPAALGLEDVKTHIETDLRLRYVGL